MCPSTVLLLAFLTLKLLCDPVVADTQQENLEEICGKVIVLPNDLHNPSLFQKCVCMVLFANSQYTYICSWMSSPGNYIIASMRTREPQDSCAAVLMLYSLF